MNIFPRVGEEYRDLPHCVNRKAHLSSFARYKLIYIYFLAENFRLARFFSVLISRRCVQQTHLQHDYNLFKRVMYLVRDKNQELSV